jgi:meso-butanediol dehydrogenase/(S,S)-butanediol dehydrogenase/diacetyl reductase
VNQVKFNFAGSTVLVTGAAGGIGKGIALGFGAAGANVVVGDMKKEDGLATVAEIEKLGGRAIFVELNVTDQEAVNAFVRKAVDTYGGVDVLVNSAGVANRVFGDPFTDLLDEDFSRTYEVNVKGMVHTCRAVYDMFRSKGAGRIINVCSVVGHSTNLLNVPYACSKAAALNLTMNLAKELGPSGVTVNALCPGYVYTPMYENAAPAMIAKMPALTGRTGKELVEYFATLNCAMKREQTPEDMANGAMFLASDGAKNITGLVLDVAGGYKI